MLYERWKTLVIARGQKCKKTWGLVCLQTKSLLEQGNIIYVILTVEGLSAEMLLQSHAFLNTDQHLSQCWTLDAPNKDA